MIIDNFILEIDKFLPGEVCSNIIDYYHIAERSGLTHGRTKHLPHEVSDEHTIITEYSTLRLSGMQHIVHTFIDNFWSVAYEPYFQKYSILGDHDKHKVHEVRLQRTLVGQGYHKWHNEDQSKHVAGRILTFIVYLNDVREGGETEFLYYPKRIKPEQGKLIMFPGAFTHAHRGNQPLSNEKYILTGWVEI